MGAPPPSGRFFSAGGADAQANGTSASTSTDIAEEENESNVLDT